MRVAVLSALAMLAATLAAAAAPNWADGSGLGAADPAYAASKAICRSAQARVPAADGPPAPPGCSSEVLYYGIGRPADPAAARACAMAERAKDPESDHPFVGDAMLMTMFANGRGAPRDLDVALALACRFDGAPAEIDGRVTHLAALKAKGPAAQPFDICDDITSGLMQGECAYHDSRIAAAARDRDFAAMAAALGPPLRARFDRLRAAAAAFAEARGGNEIDLSGTARGAFEIAAVDAVKDDLLALLRSLAGKGMPRPRPFAEEEKALNATWRAVMAVKDPAWGTPTKAGIRATQRLWLAYRDALRAFVLAEGGPDKAALAAAALTHRRTVDLKAFLA